MSGRQARASRPPRPPGLVLSIPTCARELGYSPKKTRRLIGDGLLPARRLGGKVVVLRAELERFLAELPAITTVDSALARAAAHDRGAGRATEELAR